MLMEHEKTEIYRGIDSVIFNLKHLPIDAEDDSGDGILTITPEMLTESGWQEGDIIDIKNKNGALYLTNLSWAQRVANKQQ